jgi:hypothetical protein
MEKPKVFQNNGNKKFTNNNDVFYSKNNNDVSTKNIYQKINDIFSSPNYIYKANVEISLKDKIISKRIIGRNKDFLITMDNELIRINDILDIKTVK